MKTDGATSMTAKEDQLAALLVEAGLSYREIAELMGRHDKSIKAGADRAKSGESVLTNVQTAKLKKMVALQKWLKEGERQGFLDAVAQL
jgi:transposase